MNSILLFLKLAPLIKKIKEYLPTLKIKIRALLDRFKK